MAERADIRKGDTVRRRAGRNATVGHVLVIWDCREGERQSVRVAWLKPRRYTSVTMGNIYADQLIVVEREERD